jgi:hypothetical protein
MATQSPLRRPARSNPSRKSDQSDTLTFLSLISNPVYQVSNLATWIMNQGTFRAGESKKRSRLFVAVSP